MGRARGGAGADPGTLFFGRTYDFLNVYLTRQAGRSEHTRRSYRMGLGALYDHVTGELGISPVRFTFGMCTYELLLGWSQRMQEAGLASSTVNSRIAAVRSYLRYAADGDPSLVSVWLASRKVPTLATPKRQRPIIEAGDIAAFLDAPEHTRIGNRDRFILVLMFDTAMRAAELVGVTLGDLVMPDGAPASVLVHGKGRRERRIGLSERADAHLRAYLDAYHGDEREPSTPLIYTVAHGERHAMSERNVERIVAKYGDVARTEHPDIPKTHPHMVRRTRATTLYRDGVPIEQVSTLLGHQQIETTRSHYAYPSPEQLREAVERGSGREPGTPREWVGHEEEIKRKFGL
jgi:site-specific recombinase XerD